jgi:fructuronate reductase
VTSGGLARLQPATLRLAGRATRPALASERPGVGTVHLGIGAFHRAHQAVYTAEAMEREGGNWGILGVAQRRPAAVDALGPQEGLYSLIVRGPEEDDVSVLAAVRDVLLAPREPDRLADALADPRVHVVTLTVTEKGYPRDRATGGLSVDDLEVASDLSGGPPRTAIGQLARGIALRAAAGEGGPLTVISCDNLPRNGEVVERLVRDFLARLPNQEGGHALGWLERHARFPSTMVDRVVPATTPEDREAVAQRLGLEDRGAVVAEPFSQWVIEDAFAGPRPAWEQAGALLVPDAAPHEAVKLRLLNGTHSLLAYVGGLAGARTVAGAWGDPAVAEVGERLGTDDLVPTLPAAPGIDLPAYRAELGHRWINPRIHHRLEQIGTDGSQKLPARFAEPARRRLEDGAPPRWIALVMAAWARHLREADGGLPVNDPGAEPVREALARARDHKGEAAAVLAILGDEVAASEPMNDLVGDWLARLDADGISGALKEAIRS